MKIKGLPVDIAFPNSEHSSFWHCNWMTGMQMPGGQYNTSYDPYFEDGLYHLQSDSLLIDTGNYDDYSNDFPYDMEGDDRRIEVNEYQTDKGADEYDPSGQG